MFNADTYWKSHEKDCPYTEGNKCFLIHEDNTPSEACDGCRWNVRKENEETE